MPKQPNMARTVIIALVGIAIIVFVQVKFKAVTKLADKIVGKKTEEAKKAPAEKKEGEKPEAAEEQEPVGVKAAKAQKSDFQDLLPVLGSIEGIAEIDLKFEVPGVIEFFNFKAGDRTRKGDVIARLDNKDALLKVKYRKAKQDVAQTSYDSAKKKLEIHQSLYDIGAIIKSKLEETELEAENKEKEVEAARIEVESSKQELSKTYLKSPIDGILGGRDAEPGEYVTSNNDIITLVDTRQVNVKIGIVEKDIYKLQLGQPSKFFVDTYPNKSFDGEISSITPLIKGKSRTLTVKAMVPNEENLLVPGMFARGFVTVFSKKDTFVVPIKAVETSGEESFVFVVDEKNIAHQKPVKIGYTSSSTDEVQIDEGISEGELVVTDTPIKLKEGAPVKITEKEEVSGEAPVGVGAEVKNE